MRNFIINWGEYGEMFAVVSTDATVKDVNNMQKQLKKKLDSIKPEDEDDRILTDIYDEAIKKIFHKNKFLCAILNISGILNL